MGDEAKKKKVTANELEITQESSNSATSAFPDVCKTPSPGGPVPIPYPNFAKSSDTTSGSKKVKIEGKEVIMTKKSSFEKSTGDEPGSSGWKSIANVIKRATGSKVLNVPLLVWSFGVAILLLAVWVLVTSNPQPSEPIEQYIIELIAASK